MTKEQLLAQVETLLQTMPPVFHPYGKESYDAKTVEDWSALARNVIRRWRPHVGDFVSQMLKGAFVTSGSANHGAVRDQLMEAKVDLRLDLGIGGIVVAKGQTFEYFEGVRKAIEEARNEVFLVDPYLDADVVARYLPFVSQGCAVRMLGRFAMQQLVAAVEVYANQSGLSIAVRSSPSLHDRFLFVDGSIAYVSGASFKDGAKNAPALLSPITDAFSALLQTYEQLWGGATVQRAV